MFSFAKTQVVTSVKQTIIAFFALLIIYALFFILLISSYLKLKTYTSPKHSWQAIVRWIIDS